jgi:hypothetical protein
MQPRTGSPPFIRIAASRKSGPASRFQVPNWTISILSPEVVTKCFPKSPANQRAYSSSSPGICCGGKSVCSRTRVVSRNSEYRSAKSIITIVRARSIVVRLQTEDVPSVGTARCGAFRARLGAARRACLYHSSGRYRSLVCFLAGVVNWLAMRWIDRPYRRTHTNAEILNDHFDQRRS